MQLPLTTYIAGEKTVADWNSIRALLNNFNDKTLWLKVFDDFFLTRLKDRYLDPIASIKQDGCYTGEGFSIMTIICSLIEFLETTYKGLNYRYRRNGELLIGQYEYSASGQIFVDFLTTKNPFAAHFNNQVASDFYSNIRCGLLHEARTNGIWTIWGKSNSSKLIENTATKIIVYRDDFYEGIDSYIKNDYKTELLNSNDRKAAFLRKYDKLCEE